MKSIIIINTVKFSHLFFLVCVTIFFCTNQQKKKKSVIFFGSTKYLQNIYINVSGNNM